MCSGIVVETKVVFVQGWRGGKGNLLYLGQAALQIWWRHGVAAR